jgi:hypothetical protein
VRDLHVHHCYYVKASCDAVVEMLSDFWEEAEGAEKSELEH